MEKVTNKFRGLIYSKFRSEAECARKLGWSRQRLNKISSGKMLPDIKELNMLSVILDESIERLLHIFLDDESTNEQQSA